METPKKNPKNLIFSPKFMEGMEKAVNDAVTQADAAGHPPTYEPAFSKLKEFRAKQKKSREEMLELRRQALADKPQKDHATFEFHRKVFDLLEEGDQPAAFIMRKAREVIQMWESKGLNPKYGPIWRQLLDESPTTARDFIVSDSKSEWPRELRLSSPFAHIAAHSDDEWNYGEELLKDQ
jgi:hypothetical protein